MSKERDRLYIDKDDRKLYDNIQKEEFFKGKTRKEQFILAIAFGFFNNVSKSLNNKESGGFFLIKDLKLEDEAIIKSVALYKNEDLEILTKPEEYYQIAEEYAHAGIKLINDKINSISFANFKKQFEKDIHEYYQKIKEE